MLCWMWLLPIQKLHSQRRTTCTTYLSSSIRRPLLSNKTANSLKSSPHQKIGSSVVSAAAGSAVGKGFWIGCCAALSILLAIGRRGGQQQYLGIIPYCYPEGSVVYSTTATGGSVGW